MLMCYQPSILKTGRKLSIKRSPDVYMPQKLARSFLDSACCRPCEDTGFDAKVVGVTTTLRSEGGVIRPGKANDDPFQSIGYHVHNFLPPWTAGLFYCPVITEDGNSSLDSVWQSTVNNMAGDDAC